MSFSYVLIDSKSKHIKVDSSSGILCIFDTEKAARKVREEYLSKGCVSIIRCEMSFSNKSEVQ